MGFSRQAYWSGLPFPLQWIMFCQNSPPWPICLGWPYTAWLMVSLNYTRLWSMWSVWLAFSVILIFILSALWWIRIRGLWKLPDGKDWLWGKVSLEYSWIFLGRTDAEAEALILEAPDGKNWLMWKDLDTGKDWRQEEKGMTEDEMVGWHHQLDGHQFE